MKVFLFGATGATGKEVLFKLLEQGYQVRALVRSSEKMSTVNSANLTVIEGDVNAPATYEHELKGSDVVISALGTGTNRKPTVVYSQGGKNIISTMRKTGVKKLILLTAAAFDTSDPATHNFIVKFIVCPLFRHIYADMEKLEALLESSPDIDWVCVRPTRLTSKAYTGQYRVNNKHCPKGGSKISRKDLADFIVKQISSDKYIHQKPVISY